MSLTFIGATNGTNSATLPPHQAGDIIVGMAYSDDGDHIPALASGWTSLDNGAHIGSGQNSGRSFYKIATSSSETSGTWTDSLIIVFAVYRPSSGWAVSVGDHNMDGNRGGTATYGALTLENTDGTSHVVCIGGADDDGDNIENVPSGTVLRNTFANGIEIALFDTNGGVSSWAAHQTDTGSSFVGWRTAVIELKVEQTATFISGSTSFSLTANSSELDSWSSSLVKNTIFSAVDGEATGQSLAYTATAGNLLVLVAAIDKSIAGNDVTATGFTRVGQHNTGPFVSGAVFYRIADGTETDTTVAWVEGVPSGGRVAILEFSSSTGWPANPSVAFTQTGNTAEGRSVSVGPTTVETGLAVAVAMNDSHGSTNGGTSLGWTNGYTSVLIDGFNDGTFTGTPLLTVATKNIFEDATSTTYSYSGGSIDEMHGFLAVFELAPEPVIEEISGSSSLNFTTSADSDAFGLLSSDVVTQFSIGIAPLDGSAAITANESFQFSSIGDLTAFGELSPKIITTQFTTTAVPSIVGSTDFEFTVTGTQTGEGSLASSSFPSFTTVGDLIASGALLPNPIASHFLSTAKLIGNANLVLDSIINFSIDGIMLGSSQLNTTSELNFSTQGELLGLGHITSNTNLSLTSQSDIIGQSFIESNNTLLFTVQSDIDAFGNLETNSQLPININGNLNGIGQLSSNTILGLNTLAIISGSGHITSNTNLEFINNTSLSGLGLIENSSQMLLASTGTIQGVGNINSDENIRYETQSTLLGHSSLSGQTVVEFSPNASLSGLGLIESNPLLSLTSIGVLQGVGNFTGEASHNYNTQSTLTGLGIISGQIPITFSPDVSLKALGNLESHTNLFAFSEDGILSANASLRAETSFVFNTMATFDGVFRTTGTSSISFNTMAEGKAFGTLESNISLSLNAEALITSINPINANAQVTFGTSSTISAIANLIGNSKLNLTTNANLLSDVSITGVSELSFVYNANLKGIALLTGTSNINLTTNTLELTGAGLLSGNSILSLTNNALLSAKGKLDSSVLVKFNTKLVTNIQEEDDSLNSIGTLLIQSSVQTNEADDIINAVGFIISGNVTTSIVDIIEQDDILITKTLQFDNDPNLDNIQNIKSIDFEHLNLLPPMDRILYLNEFSSFILNNNNKVIDTTYLDGSFYVGTNYPVKPATFDTFIPRGLQNLIRPGSLLLNEEDNEKQEIINKLLNKSVVQQQTVSIVMPTNLHSISRPGSTLNSDSDPKQVEINALINRESIIRKKETLITPSNLRNTTRPGSLLDIG